MQRRPRHAAGDAPGADRAPRGRATTARRRPRRRCSAWRPSTARRPRASGTDRPDRGGRAADMVLLRWSQVAAALSRCRRAGAQTPSFPARRHRASTRSWSAARRSCGTAASRVSTRRRHSASLLGVSPGRAARMRRNAARWRAASALCRAAHAGWLDGAPVRAYEPRNSRL